LKKKKSDLVASTALTMGSRQLSLLLLAYELGKATL
jgi:hypothetical protein